MTGTPKQVKWAEDIKGRFEVEAENLRARYANKARKAGQEEQLNRTIDLLIQTVTANTDAKWWIDNRDIDSTASEEFKNAYTAAAQQVQAEMGA
jgi:hypothetical protein